VATSDVKTRLLWLMARKALQPIWQLLYKAAIGGMGHMNADPRLNGEDLQLRTWARGLVEAGRTAPVVFDIGANEGNFAAAVLALLPNAEVHCFEPHPATSARLKARFADAARVSVHAVGIGETAGALALYDYSGGAGSAHASFLSDTFIDVFAADSEMVEVPITTVDELVTREGVGVIDLVKIDVEGFERNVIAGMAEAIRQGRIERVQFEFNAHNALTGFTLHELGRMLPGYDVFKILTDDTEPVLGVDVEYDSRIEIFKYANYVATRHRA
jgi:FkbM family methyltransferase